ALGRLVRSWHSSGLGGQRVVTHDGLTTQVALVPADGGPAPLTRHTTDVFGRLVRVEEQLDDGSVATTTYTYDANDHVRQIVNADGVAVSLTHDWRGKRTAIERGGRAWRYAYDPDGNLERIVAPHPPGHEAEYTTQIIHDALGRMI